MSINLGARKHADAEINVTPLIDVLLVLLIIFMTILPHHRLGEPAAIPLPSRDQPPVQPPDTAIVIQLLNTGDGVAPEIKINSAPVAWDSLETTLGKIYETRAEKVAFLKGDPEIDFQYVADALDVAHHAGVDRIGLMDADTPAHGDAAWVKR